MRKIVILALSFLVTISAAAAAGPRKIVPGPDTKGQLFLPLAGLVVSTGPHIVTLVTTVDEAELFREEYRVTIDANLATALQLRLEGAGPLDLAKLADSVDDRIAFDIVVDGSPVKRFHPSELLKASVAAPRRAAVQRPFPDVTYAIVPAQPKPRVADTARRALRPATNTFTGCPSASTGICQDDFNACMEWCGAPPDSRYEPCLLDCQTQANNCAYGAVSETTSDSFLPDTRRDDVNGFYPWYEFYNIHVWQEWEGNHHHRVYTSYICTYDGVFGPYETVEIYRELCYYETSERVLTGGYLGGVCKNP